MQNEAICNVFWILEHFFQKRFGALWLTVAQLNIQ